MACPIWMAKSISVTGLRCSHSSFLILYPRLYWNSPNSLWSCPDQTSQLPACGERRRWNGPARKLGDCLPVCLSMASLFWWRPLYLGLSASQFPFCIWPLFSQYLFMNFFSLSCVSGSPVIYSFIETGSFLNLKCDASVHETGERGR